MSQLIEIKTVPIEIEMKMSSARLEYKRASADLEISRDKDGLNIKSQPIRLNTDTFEKLPLKAKIGEDIPAQYPKTTLSPDMDARQELAFLPSVGQEISLDAGELNIRFEMDKLNFEWRINANEFKFTPGDIEFSVKQQPDVIIKYIGDPLYVPPSADPNYEPVDVNA